MKAIVQRVRGLTKIECSEAQTRLHADEFKGPGLVALLAWGAGDEILSPQELQKKEEWIRSRIQGLRIFPDRDGKMNLSLADYLSQENLSGGMLWVSQFTLAAKLESGFRPSFTAAMKPDLAKSRFEEFCDVIRASARPEIKDCFGVFGADMNLEFTNWGPVTIPLES